LDCGSDQTGQTTTLMAITANTTIHNVTARTLTAFNGSSPSCEIGITGNVNKYIDDADFEPQTANFWVSSSGESTDGPTGAGTNDTKVPHLLLTATNLIATWTNTGGSAGEIHVYVTYSVDPVTKIDVSG